MQLTQSLIALSLLVLFVTSPFTLERVRRKQPGCSTAVACQKVANAAYAAEMARAGHECRAASNQSDGTACAGAAMDSTETNFAKFYGALEQIVGRDAVHDAQTTWLDYRKKQCGAVSNFFRPGTIAPSAQVWCEISLTRSRMRDLDTLFDVPLHH